MEALVPPRLKLKNRLRRKQLFFTSQPNYGEKP
jgi:hypothetical protein